MTPIPDDYREALLHAEEEAGKKLDARIDARIDLYLRQILAEMSSQSRYSDG